MVSGKSRSHKYLLVAVAALLRICQTHAEAQVADATEVLPGRIFTVAEERPLAPVMNHDSIAFYGASGLEVDPGREDLLYLTDKGRHMVFRVDLRNHRISPVAGRQAGGFNGDLQPLETLLHVPAALAAAPDSGDLYVADTQNHRVRRIPRAGGAVVTVAGTGIRGVADDRIPTVFPGTDGFATGHFSGDGGLAPDAELNLPSGVAISRQRLLLIADSGNHRIRAVNLGHEPKRFGRIEIGPGRIETIAGTGEFGFGGDGGLATTARMAFPTEIKVDADCNVFFVDTFNHRIRRIDRENGTIDTVVRSPAAERSPEKSLEGWHISIVGLALAPGGDVVYSDRSERSVYRLTAGDRQPLLVARRGEIGPGSVTVDATGRIFVADVYYNRVVQISGDTAITVAGGAGADENAAVKDLDVSILGPLTIDPQGDLFLPDAMHYSVRRIRRDTGRVETFMGNGHLGVAGDAGPPENAELVHPTDVLIDGLQNVYVADQYGNLVRRISATESGARVTTFAGRRGSLLAAEDVPATAARLGGPLALARHPLTGDIYIACQESHSVRMVNASGDVVTVAGTGTAGFSGDGASARNAQFNWPAALAFADDGTLYISDMLNNRIRRITPGGRIQTFAGTGRQGYSGDGGPADQAELNYPAHLAFGPDGNLYFSDMNNHRVRRIQMASPHRIDTVVGIGQRGYSSDGTPATSARLNLPRGLAFGPDKTLFVVDSFNRKIRAVRLELAPALTKRD